MEIQNISLETLDSLFGDTPAKPVAAAEAPIEGSDVIQEQQTLQPTTSYSSIQSIDNSAFDDLTDDDDDDDTSDVKKGDGADKIDKVDKTDKGEPKAPTEVSSVLKNTVDYMIDKGFWKDFEGREELEIDDETYGDLASRQFEAKVNEVVSEIFDSTGEYGKAIIRHIREGGDPDEIIDIFKEQQSTNIIDTSDDEGKMEIVGKYYSEVLGWKPERIKKHVQRIIDGDDLETEASEIEDKYKEYFSQELIKVQNEQNSRKEQSILNQRRFEENIKDTLQELEYSDSDKSKIINSLLGVKKLPNGQVTTDFNMRFAQIQQDPKKLVKLVDFILDEENFINKLQKKANTNAAAKAFNFIKGNASTSKNKGSSFEEKPTKKKDLDFSSFLK